MGEPFERTVALINGILKPMARLLKENPIPPYGDYVDLFAAAINRDHGHFRFLADLDEQHIGATADHHHGWGCGCRVRRVRGGWDGVLLLSVLHPESCHSPG